MLGELLKNAFGIGIGHAKFSLLPVAQFLARENGVSRREAGGGASFAAPEGRVALELGAPNLQRRRAYRGQPDDVGVKGDAKIN
jgi:hypothetical protein